MKRFAILLFLFFGLFLGMARACDSFATCPYDGQSANSTGETKIEDGKTFWKYSHPVPSEHTTHTFWAQCSN